ncbi:RNA-directed DNA polymerase, eukaryota [Tanacetum coccineum]
MDIAIFYRPGVVCDQHNHRPTEHLEGHAYARRLSNDEFRLVEELTRKNVPPREILSTLKDQDETNLSTLLTIYEAQKKIREVERDWKTPMQVLMSIFVDNRYVYQTYTHPITNQLKALFFVHPTSYEIWHALSHVLIIDATYKTNVYNMPFVQIVGVTSTRKTFCIAFVFISEEKEENYKWAVEQLKWTLNECMHARVIVTDRELTLMNACEKVFPHANHLLCRWHINSPTWISYTENYEKLQTFLSPYPRVLRYIQEKKQSYPARLFGVDLNAEPERHSSYANNKQQEKKQSYSCKSFDIDPNMQPRRHSSFLKSQRGRTHNLIPDLNEEPPRHISFVSQTSTLHYFEISKSKRLRRQIPIVFHPYISISSLQDVKPDGNCGFRSVALGLGLPEDHWPRIRSDLVRQLESRQHQYRSIFGTRGYNQIYSSVRLAGEWMEMPHTGLVIASAYNKVVVSLSNDGGCATSFPLWSSPPQSDSNEIIVIAHVNGDHYIRVELRKGFPLPITHPLWITYRSNITSGWGDKYVTRQNNFRKYYFRDPESYDLT